MLWTFVQVPLAFEGGLHPRSVNIDQAVEVANLFALSKGRDLEAYEQPTADLDGGKWHLHYLGKRRMVGDHFTVYVDDATGEARLVLGR